jgi:alginate O-acetyltransferase complex protein AlgI
LRDYLFLPVAYSVSRRIKSDRLMGIKAENWAYYLGSMITMTLCGLWHGASWTFVIWGGFYGLLLVVEHAGWGRILKRMGRPWSILYTQFMVVVAWVFFRSDGMGYALQYLKAMFGMGTGEGLEYYPLLYLDREVVFFGLIGILFSTSLPLRIKNLLKERISKLPRPFENWLRYLVLGIKPFFLGAVFVFCVMTLASGTYNPFIYFRF